MKEGIHIPGAIIEYFLCHVHGVGPSFQPVVFVGHARPVQPGVERIGLTDGHQVVDGALADEGGRMDQAALSRVSLG